MERARTAQIIEQKLQEREPRLPDGAKKYIRRLKQQGKLAETIDFRNRNLHTNKSPKQILEEELNTNIRQLLTSDSEKLQAESALKITWILNATSQITTEERESDLYQIHRLWPEQSPYLSNIDASVVDKIYIMVANTINS